jgi:AcrR family transcriptional regulator
MARVTKDPEERRNEFLDVAEQLFIEKGYENTSMSDIIKAVGVAQGTIYYYFKSREEVLVGIIDRYFERYRHGVEAIADDARLDATQKLQRVLDLLFADYGGRGREGLEAFVALATRHERYWENIHSRLLPLIFRMIEQGIDEGAFRPDYPRETTEFLIVLLRYLHDNQIRMGREERLRKKAAAEALFVNVLGVGPGTLKIPF